MATCSELKCELRFDKSYKNCGICASLYVSEPQATSPPGPQVCSKDLLSALRALTEEWDELHSYLNNPHDDPADRMVGQTYQTCADQLKKLIGT